MKKTIIFFLLLIIGFITMHADNIEYIYAPGEILISFVERLSIPDLLDFIADYEQYELCLINQEFGSNYPIAFFYFNNSRISEKELLSIIREDERVYAAQLNYEYFWFHPKYAHDYYGFHEKITFVLNDVRQWKEFFRDYAHYELVWERWGSTYLGNPLHYVFRCEWDYDTIELFDLLELIRDDPRVYTAGIPYRYFPGHMWFSFERGTTLDYMIEIVNDFFIYDMRIVHHSTMLGSYMEVSYDFNLIFDPEFMKIVKDREYERIVRIEFTYISEGMVPEDPPINTEDSVIPINPLLSYAYPNPVLGDEVSILFKNQNINLVTEQVISIYNIRGQLVHKSSDIQAKDGENIFTWDLRNTKGQRVSSGVYFYRISSPIAPPINVGDELASVQIRGERTEITGRFLIIK